MPYFIGQIRCSELCISRCRFQLSLHPSALFPGESPPVSDARRQPPKAAATRLPSSNGRLTSGRVELHAISASFRLRSSDAAAPGRFATKGRDDLSGTRVYMNEDSDELNMLLSAFLLCTRSGNGVLGKLTIINGTCMAEVDCFASSA
eukprot:6508697-Pyramimonas_sp.AAC.1